MLKFCMLDKKVSNLVLILYFKKKYKIKKSTGIQKNQYITLNLQHLYASLSRAVEWTRPRA